MRKKLSLLIIWVLSLSLPPVHSQMLNKHCVSEIVQTVRTINPNDEDYSDLQFLKENLKGVNIVLLGEQAHGDGSTYAAKSRLVKFLHKEMDFDVLVFESSIIDCQIAWNCIKEGLDPYESFGKGVFKFWSVSKYTTELIRYLGEQSETNDPLILAGFDFQFSGKIKFKERQQAIIDFLRNEPKEVQIEQLPHIMEYLENPNRFFKPKAMLDIDSTYQNELLKELNLVSEQWDQNQWSQEQAVISRFFTNTPKLMHFIWNMDYRNIDSDVANIRDQVMAENLIWLKENVYPGKKIIVWGANSHLGYNRNLLEPADQMIPMGHYLKDRYSNKMYTIAATSYDGFSGSVAKDTIIDLPTASADCIESTLNDLGYDYGFLNMKSRKAKKCLNTPFKSRIYGFGNYIGDWTKMVDGILFINTMEPNVVRK